MKFKYGTRWWIFIASPLKSILYEPVAVSKIPRMSAKKTYAQNCRTELMNLRKKQSIEWRKKNKSYEFCDIIWLTLRLSTFALKCSKHTKLIYLYSYTHVSCDEWIEHFRIDISLLCTSLYHDHQPRFPLTLSNRTKITRDMHKILCTLWKHWKFNTCDECTVQISVRIVRC